MSDFRLRAESCLGAGFTPHSFSRPGRPLVAISEQSPVFVLEIAAFRAIEHDDVRHFQAELGAPPPSRGTMTLTNGAEIVSIGPNRWVATAANPVSFAASANFAVTDLGSARGYFTVSGEKAAAVLSKGTSIDLDAKVFASGSAAATRVSHFSTVIWRPQETGGFSILVPRSFARAFYHWLVLAAAEFGIVGAA